MDLKSILANFTYRIEAKPEGGFMARAGDPSLPPLEAATRSELEDKIQGVIAAAMSKQFPMLNLPLAKKELKFSFHVEPKPGGGYIARSNDPDAPPIEGASHEEVSHQFAERLIGGFAGFVFPELSKALGKAVDSGDVKVFVTRNVTVTKSGEDEAKQGSAGLFLPSQNPGSHQTSVSPQSEISSIATDNSPIQPEASGSGKVLRFLIPLLIMGALLYFFSLRVR